MDADAVALLTDLQKKVELLERRPKERGSKLATLYAGFEGLPALRGLWYPGATTGETGSLPDYSGSARTLTYNGNPTINLHDFMLPYFDYDGTGDFHSRADEAGLDVLGTETYVAAALRGMTVGGLFWLDSVASTRYLFAKANSTGNQRSWSLVFSTSIGSKLRFEVSSLGTAASLVNADTAGAPSTGAWHFIVGRFKPSTEMKIWLDKTAVVNTTSIPASIFNSTANVRIASSDDAAQTLDGRCMLAFYAACAFPDELVDYLFNHCRQLVGI